MSLKILLVALILAASCKSNAPQIPRNPKILDHYPTYEMWCRLRKPTEAKVSWAHYFESDGKYYECTDNPEHKRFSVTLDEDLAMISQYIITMHHKCKKWARD